MNDEQKEFLIGILEKESIDTGFSIYSDSDREMMNDIYQILKK